MKLFSYFRSSAAYRVRIALNLKGIATNYEAVHLLKDGGRQFAPDYRRRNPLAILRRSSSTTANASRNRSPSSNISTRSIPRHG